MPTTRVAYEWLVETVLMYPNGETDIVDHYHTDAAADALRRLGPDKSGEHGTLSTRLVLVRDEVSDHYGVEDRAWAYVAGDQLPEYFHDTQRCTAKVPQRFHTELHHAVHQQGARR